MEKRYETVFILTPVLSDDQAKEAAKKFKKIVTDLGAKVINEEHWGLRKLAYPIQKKTTGLYLVVEFDAPTDLIAKLELQLNRDENVMRHMVNKLDKHAVAYNLRKRNKNTEVAAS